MSTNNGVANQDEAVEIVEGPPIILTMSPKSMSVPVSEASAAILRKLAAVKQQAERDFDLVHTATCVALGLDPVEWRAVNVDDNGAVTLCRAE